MIPVASRLKQLRMSATPRLSLRAVAEKLGIGHTTYAFYENASSYKKGHLPIDLARRIAAIFADYGIDPAEVMKLAGLADHEAEPEGREIEAAKPKIQFFTAQVAMPSEAALAAMLEPIMALIPRDASPAEAARILARRLPAGFAAIGPGVIELAPDEEPVPDARPPARATRRPASRPHSRS